MPDSYLCTVFHGIRFKVREDWLSWDNQFFCFIGPKRNKYRFPFCQLSRKSILSAQTGNTICAESFYFLLNNFYYLRREFLFPPKKFLLSAQKKFVTKFVTHIRNFVTHITKFVIHVRKFVTKNLLWEREKYQGERKKYQGEGKKFHGLRNIFIVAGGGLREEAGSDLPYFDQRSSWKFGKNRGKLRFVPNLFCYK